MIITLIPPDTMNKVVGIVIGALGHLGIQYSTREVELNFVF